MDRELARKMWRTMEPYHGMIYFVPEAAEEYAAIGLEGNRMGYFASRSAPMGPVRAEVVIATFFNFYPGLVRRVIPEAWRRATPEAITTARLAAAGRALRRLLGDSVDAPEMSEAAALARRAAEAAPIEGRPLFAGHAALDWPEAPHLVLWHAITLLREFRGDGHIAAMVGEGITGCEALVIHGATGDVPPEILKMSRAWPDDEWAACTDGLRERGLIDAQGSLTQAGRAHRDRVERLTDESALRPWASLGEDSCDRLRTLARPFSKLIADETFRAMPSTVWDTE